MPSSVTIRVIGAGRVSARLGPQWAITSAARAGRRALVQAAGQDAHVHPPSVLCVTVRWGSVDMHVAAAVAMVAVPTVEEHFLHGYEMAKQHA